MFNPLLPCVHRTLGGLWRLLVGGGGYCPLDPTLHGSLVWSDEQRFAGLQGSWGFPLLRGVQWLCSDNGVWVYSPLPPLLDAGETGSEPASVVVGGLAARGLRGLACFGGDQWGWGAGQERALPIGFAHPCVMGCSVPLVPHCMSTPLLALAVGSRFGAREALLYHWVQKSLGVPRP